MTTKVTIAVKSYNEDADTFEVFMDMPEVPCGGGIQTVDAVALACMLRQWGEPSEFVGKTFRIEF